MPCNVWNDKTVPILRTRIEPVSYTHLNNVDDDFIDYLCLHLSFYLASWGMYRGSSFLLQRDYKVHKPVIKILLEDKYNSLWGIEINQYKNIENQEKLKDLVSRIKEVYNEIRLSVKESIPKNELSDTLVTKVLMGTLGCVPAYDRYFISGVRNEKAASGNFNIRSILELVEFYNKYYDDFEQARKQMMVCGMAVSYTHLRTSSEIIRTCKNRNDNELRNGKSE